VAPEDDNYKARKFQGPEFIPANVGFMPVTWKKHREALEEIVLRHPVICGPHQKGSVNFDAPGDGTYRQGEHVDEWGCVWSNVCEGYEAYVSGHPLPRREMVRDLRPPPPGAGHSYGILPHGFLFLRLTYLRGYEEIMLDFAEEPPELQRLIDIVLDYNAGELKQLLARPPELQYFGDDLGTQRSLPISPETWRKYLKPCYAKLYRMCHDAGTDVYMHSDGHIIPIIKYLIECGVDVLNVQARANGLRRLAEECRGKVCVSLDLDDQMLPFATPEEIDAHVRECVETLALPQGGLCLLSACGPDVPLANIEAVCQAMEKYRGYFR